MQITNEDMNVIEKMRNLLLKETRERLPSLKGIGKHRLLEATRKVRNITELNDLVYAGAVVVMEMLRVKNRKSTGMET